MVIFWQNRRFFRLNLRNIIVISRLQEIKYRFNESLLLLSGFPPDLVQTPLWPCRRLFPSRGWEYSRGESPHHTYHPVVSRVIWTSKSHQSLMYHYGFQISSYEALSRRGTYTSTYLRRVFEYSLVWLLDGTTLFRSSSSPVYKERRVYPHLLFIRREERYSFSIAAPHLSSRAR